MSTRTIGVVMNGVTGRMGTNQHLLRSIVPIIRQGGVRRGEEAVVPEPLLVGRDPAKLEAVARSAGLSRWTTDLDAALSDPGTSVYFDAQTTLQRAAGVRRALAAGKHVYCEKPTATGTAEALELFRLARDRGLKHGVVQDKL
ncbi:MAG TPA: Gfo/Idh/MocA family oxidoreductase, partial [Longimicrobiales bacterium]